MTANERLCVKLLVSLLKERISSTATLTNFPARSVQILDPSPSPEEAIRSGGCSTLNFRVFLGNLFIPFLKEEGEPVGILPSTGITKKFSIIFKKLFYPQSFDSRCTLLSFDEGIFQKISLFFNSIFERIKIYFSYRIIVWFTKPWKIPIWKLPNRISRTPQQTYFVLNFDKISRLVGDSAFRPRVNDLESIEHSVQSW